MSSNVKAAAPKVKGRFTVKAVNRAPVGSTAKNGVEKRKRGTSHNDNDSESLESDEEYGMSEEASDVGEDGDVEADTDDEIAAAHSGKSKKTAKRKRRATSPSTFGATLEELLGNVEEGDEEGEAEAGPSRTTKTAAQPQQPAILSLAPHIRRGAQSSRLNAKAARIALAARRKREDRAHVTDVIGGWGAPGELPKTADGDEKPVIASEAQEGVEAEKLKAWLQEGGVQGYEKRLRKVAQRGVVKLFNAIRAAQNTNEDDLEEAQPVKAASTDVAATKNVKKADNPLGGKTKAINELSKNNFFDLLRAGKKGQPAA